VDDGDMFTDCLGRNPKQSDNDEKESKEGTKYKIVGRRFGGPRHPQTAKHSTTWDNQLGLTTTDTQREKRKKGPKGDEGDGNRKIVVL